MPILTFLLRAVVLCGLVWSARSLPLAQANPQQYPAFAQQQLDPGLPIAFVAPSALKQQLETGTPPLVVDVRSAGEFAEVHIPGAVSIPLEGLAGRLAEIRREGQVVLY